MSLRFLHCERLRVYSCSRLSPCSPSIPVKRQGPDGSFDQLAGLSAVQHRTYRSHHTAMGSLSRRGGPGGPHHLVKETKYMQTDVLQMPESVEEALREVSRMKTVVTEAVEDG